MGQIYYGPQVGVGHPGAVCDDRGKCGGWSAQHVSNGPTRSTAWSRRPRQVRGLVGATRELRPYTIYSLESTTAESAGVGRRNNTCAMAPMMYSSEPTARRRPRGFSRGVRSNCFVQASAELVRQRHCDALHSDVELLDFAATQDGPDGRRAAHQPCEHHLATADAQLPLTPHREQQDAEWSQDDRIPLGSPCPGCRRRRSAAVCRPTTRCRSPQQSRHVRHRARRTDERCRAAVCRVAVADRWY